MVIGRTVQLRSLTDRLNLSEAVWLGRGLFFSPLLMIQLKKEIALMKKKSISHVQVHRWLGSLQKGFHGLLSENRSINSLILKKKKKAVDLVIDEFAISLCKK